MAIESEDRVHAAAVVEVSAGVATPVRSKGVLEVGVNRIAPGRIRIILTEPVGADEVVPWMNVEAIGETLGGAAISAVGRVSDSEYDCFVYLEDGTPTDPDRFQVAIIKFSQGLGS